MKDVLPPPKDHESLSEAYKQLLGNALQRAHQNGVHLYHVIGEIRSEIVGLGKIGENEAATLELYVKRDLADAARYLGKTGRALTDWVGFDVALIERAFWDLFSAAADKTTTELFELKLQASAAAYRTGELTGLGTLVCDQCGATLHFHKPEPLPRCPQCNGSHFHRPDFDNN